MQGQLSDMLLFILLALFLTASSATLPKKSAKQLLRIDLDMCSTAGGPLPLRRDYRDLSADEWTRFHGALQALAAMPSPDRRQARRGWNELDWWTRVHLDSVPQAHLYPHSH